MRGGAESSLPVGDTLRHQGGDDSGEGGRSAGGPGMHACPDSWFPSARGETEKLNPKLRGDLDDLATRGNWGVADLPSTQTTALIISRPSPGFALVWKVPIG